MRRRLLIIYFLTTLLLCCAMLHAGKAPAGTCTGLLSAEASVLKIKTAGEMGRFIPSVLLF